MGDFEKLALIHAGIGIEMFSLGFLRSMYHNTDVEAMFIIGYLLFVTAAILMLLLVVGELKGNKIAMIVTMVLFFCAALFILVGWALWADLYKEIGDTYAFTLDVFSTVMAILAGVFLLLVVAGIGGGSRGGSRTEPTKA